MTCRFRYEAREWLKDNTDNWIYDSANDDTHGHALVADLYRAGAVKVEVSGIEEVSNCADQLYVTLPEARDKALEVMTLLAQQRGDEVDLVDKEKDVVRIWWD